MTFIYFIIFLTNINKFQPQQNETFIVLSGWQFNSQGWVIFLLISTEFFRQKSIIICMKTNSFICLKESVKGRVLGNSFLPVRNTYTHTHTLQLQQQHSYLNHVADKLNSQSPGAGDRPRHVTSRLFRFLLSFTSLWGPAMRCGAVDQQLLLGSAASEQGAVTGDEQLENVD